MENEKIKFVRDTTLINSWHINNQESAAMWDLYSSRNTGIAIQSTYRRLSECFNENADESIFLGQVKYIDYRTDYDISGTINLFDPILRKRNSFSHELELRAISSLMMETDLEAILNNDRQLHPPLEKKERHVDPKRKTDIGIYIDVDLEKLIDKIFIYPCEQQWTFDLVESVAKRYNIGSKEIIQSDLYSVP